MELLLVLLEDAVVVVLPELLGSVLASYALEDWNMSEYEMRRQGRRRHTLLAARMLLLEVGKVIYVFVHYNVQIIRCFMRRDVRSRKALRHVYNDGKKTSNECKKYS